MCLVKDGLCSGPDGTGRTISGALSLIGAVINGFVDCGGPRVVLALQSGTSLQDFARSTQAQLSSGTHTRACACVYCPGCHRGLCDGCVKFLCNHSTLWMTRPHTVRRFLLEAISVPVMSFT